jgi:hypothetical protein
MGKGHIDELGEYFLRAADVATVWTDGAQDVATLELEEGRISAIPSVRRRT